MKKIIYIKKIPKDIKNILEIEEEKPKSVKIIAKIIPSLFIFVGCLMLTIVLYPIFLYQIQYIPRTFRREIIKPIKIIENYEIQASSKESENQQKIMSQISQIDTTNAKTWFPKANFVKTPNAKIVNYTISIPRFKIFNANVEIGSEDLKKSLIHYPQSALPGELGNPVIFGHSTLPIFFNPKNYETIFSTLPEIQKGDEIIARVDGIEYTYKVYDLFTVNPNEIYVLEQKYDKYDMSLITCVPPGTKWKRLVVKAKLKEE